MAQIINPGRRDKGNLLDAMARVLQGYQAFTGARQNVAQTDAINQKIEDENEGYLSKEKQVEIAKAGGKFSSEPSEGALQFKDKSLGTLYLTPPTQKAELMTPYEAQMLKLRERELGNKEKNDAREYSLKERSLNAKEIASNTPKTYDEKVKDLNASDKARFDNVNMASNAIDSMRQALASGQKTWSLIGDNDFTVAEREFAEALGRMQSGGAISKEEEKRFAAMAPKAFDSPELRKKKLDRIEQEMTSRLNTLGFKREEVPQLAEIDKRRALRQIASEKPGPGTAIADTKGPYMPGSVIEVNGQKILVGPDGKSGTPVK